MKKDYDQQHDNHLVQDASFIETLNRVRPTWKRELVALIAGLALAGLILSGYNQILWGSVWGPHDK